MADIKVTFPDSSVKEYPAGITALDVAKGISEGLARECVVAKVDGQLRDMATTLTTDCQVEFFKFDSREGKEVFWHSSAHILAQAVKRLYPDAKPTIGPPLEEGGFYYDFANLKVGEEDLRKLEEEMLKIAKENFESKRIDYKDKKQAKAPFTANEYKLEIIDGAEGGLSAYQQGEFIDFCRGPHIPRTGMVKAAWLHKLAGAYWRGDADNEQLTRIYGITFPDKKLLRQHQALLEEAKKRDHRVLGKKLDLYGFEEVSPGSPFFYPKGTVMYNELYKFVREEYRKRGYDEVITPLLYDKELWVQSGHWEHYQDNMFILKDGNHEMSLKPMNCPSHCLIYNRTQWSYRDLPQRIADFAALHRNELRGVLGGLTRVRKFSQDDAHIFCTPDQVEEEIRGVINFAKYIYEDVMKMKFTAVYLSTRPEKFLGEEKIWDKAEAALSAALKAEGMEFEINEGDGAFYGPKIDFQIKDALGRLWQTATVQLDFNLPERFKCDYIGEDGAKHRVVMIHRALLGSFERFIGVLVEHYAGKMPLWISPEQVRILPVSENHLDYAKSVANTLKGHGIRAHADESNETLGKKVREAQLDYVPYILVVGDKERDENTVTVRTRDNEVHGAETVESFAKRVETEIATRQ